MSLKEGGLRVKLGAEELSTIRTNTLLKAVDRKHPGHHLRTAQT
ncbi:hypothetical protein [Cupriavidus necator]|nr:hypothetical protein [Cupriavidus necator]